VAEVVLSYLQRDGYEGKESKEGIRIRETHTACPQENSIAERMSRTLMNMSRGMLIHTNLPKRFWDESVNTACYLKNLLPTRALDGKIPF
jgi:hypothetical protein